jgi:hypothetical protein
MRWVALTALFVLSTGIPGIAGAEGLSDKKQSLETSRHAYRDAAAAHGASSPEAKSARVQLRKNRQEFHQALRQERRRHADASGNLRH